MNIYWLNGRAIITDEQGRIVSNTPLGGETKRPDRIAFIRQFIDDRWYATIGGITDDILVVVPRDIMALYRHRRPKK